MDPAARAWLGAYNALLPGARLALGLAPHFSDKLVRRARDAEASIAAALERVQRLRGERQRVVLFHAASAGELEQLKPVLRRVDRARLVVVLSVFSPTVYDAAAAGDLADASCYLPIDFRREARTFFRHLRCADFVITRHDLWPNHLAAARATGARTVLINANLHVRSLRLRPWARPATRALFSLVDSVLTGSERLRARLTRVVDPVRIEVTGDTRFDQVWERARSSAGAERPPTLPGAFLAGHRVLVLGSVLESDERVLFAGWRQALGRSGGAALEARKLRLLHVPHEVDPATLRRVERRYRELSLPTWRLSEGARYAGQPVILVDSVGILPELYAHGCLAYVGGGFGAGVHSVIEPAAQRCAVAFGPRAEILDEALDLRESGIAVPIDGAAGAADLLDLSCDAARLDPLRDAALGYVEGRLGAADRVVRTLFGER